MGILDGQVVLVTGSGGVLGKPLTDAVWAEGAITVGCGRTGFTKWTDRSAYAKCDLVRDPMSRLIDNVLLHYGRLDAIVSCAGKVGVATMAEYYTLNTMVPVFLLQTAVEHVGNGLKRFVQISGGGATGPADVPVGYAMSKAAVVRGMEMLSKVYPDVAINCLAPGDLSKQSASVAAECAVWLLSPASQGLTGKLVAAQWDEWLKWTPERIAEIMATSAYTVRRTL